MIWRGRVGNGKRALLFACSVVLAAASMVFWIRHAGGDHLALALDVISSAPFIVAVALSLYWPAVIVAFAAQAIKILVLFDAAAYNIPPPHTGNILTDIMVAVAEGATAGGRLTAVELALALFGVGLLIFVVKQRYGERKVSVIDTGA